MYPTAAPSAPVQNVNTPDPMGPPAALPPLSPTEVAAWWTRVELARARRKKELDRWKVLLKAYLPALNTDADAINSNLHFRNVHLKIAEMWAQLPELVLTPLEPLRDLIDPQTGQPLNPGDVLAIKRAVLNKLLGRDGANLNATIVESLFAIFMTAGLGATKICYEADSQEVAPPEMPLQPGAILGLNAPPTPAPVVVHERWRWYHFSEAKFLKPHDAVGTDFDEMPWLGMEFVEPLTDATRQKYHLPPDFQSNVTKDDLILTSEQESASLGTDQLLKGVEIWLHAAPYDAQEANSQVFYRLVLVEGQKEKEAVYERSPYQTKGPDGRLTADSMLGNAIHPIVLRAGGDLSWVPADAAFTDPLVKQLNTWRSQDIKQRDANLARFVHSDGITAAIDKLKDADTGQGVAIPADLMAQGVDRLIAPLPHLERAEADIRGEASVRRDLDETLGLGANQAGGTNATVRSATELAVIQANVSVRLKAEQTMLLERVLAGIRKFDSLIQRFATDTDYVEIVGQEGTKRLQAWNQHTIAGRYAYDAKPDTQLTMDPSQRIKRVLDFVNFMAKSPFMNQQELARTVCTEFGYDPARMIQQPNPPPPEKPSVSFAFHGADLAIPEVRQILQGAGIQLPPQPSPEVIQAALAEQAKKLPHGGAADRVETISQHHGELTGKLPGAPPVGVPAVPQPAGVQ
jgi:hypothetical protein